MPFLNFIHRINPGHKQLRAWNTPGLLAFMISTILLIASLPTNAQEVERKKEWAGTLESGIEITERDLANILEEHKKWFDTEGKQGRRANLAHAHLSEALLIGADLSGANLSRANLYLANLHLGNLRGADLHGTELCQADLSGADLSRAKLREADLSEANLRSANLIEADLSRAKLRLQADLSWARLGGAILSGADLGGAILIGADLSEALLIGADLRGANLSRAKLRGANLSKTVLTNANLTGADLRWVHLSEAKLNLAKLRGANANFADFSDSIFEPDNIDGLTILGAEGFSTIKFDKFKSVIELRKVVKEAGLRNQERALTAALRKYRLKGATDYGTVFEYLFIDLPTDSGANPWRCVNALGFLIIIFSVFYVLMLRKRGVDGIWKVWIPERVRMDLGAAKPVRLKLRGLASLKLALYFSFLSAFSIGWRELNVGNWIARIQRREYTLRATGWTRTISGFQSLLSVYLLALWALTYFGRPFD